MFKAILICFFVMQRAFVLAQNNNSLWDDLDRLFGDSLNRQQTTTLRSTAPAEVPPWLIPQTTQIVMTTQQSSHSINQPTTRQTLPPWLLNPQTTVQQGTTLTEFVTNPSNIAQITQLPLWLVPQTKAPINIQPTTEGILQQTTKNSQINFPMASSVNNPPTLNDETITQQSTITNTNSQQPAQNIPQKQSTFPSWHTGTTITSTHPTAPLITRQVTTRNTQFTLPNWLTTTTSRRPNATIRTTQRFPTAPVVTSPRTTRLITTTRPTPQRPIPITTTRTPPTTTTFKIPTTTRAHMTSTDSGDRRVEITTRITTERPERVTSATPAKNNNEGLNELMNGIFSSLDKTLSRVVPMGGLFSEKMKEKERLLG